ncbi:aminotransferase class IV [Azospirillum agricola]|uniref:aminotransferase class IV n=1 Tax=Azospirillum agricola TaxID=1720247 RepID=UPI000A0F1366|nr:aminotransferase class IV [Azospirillum agricola]SMH62176.1 branched-chain amino acid aminotransferase [Azospirillum lipoferum]
MTSAILWLNGALLEESAARVDPADRGFTLGDGLFETLRVSDDTPRHLGRHLARLRAGAALLDLPLPWSDAELAAAMERLLAATTGPREGSLRLTVTRGVAARGVLPPAAPSPSLLITRGGLPPDGPVRAVVATVTRRNEHSPLSRLKTLNYLDAILARQEAARRGADDALLLNTAGRLAEASAANLFLRRGDRLLTPPVAEGALPGIARALVLEDHAAGLPVEEHPLTLADLAGADEAFLTNSLGLRPLVAVDGVAVGDGRPGPIFRSLAINH